MFTSQEHFKLHITVEYATLCAVLVYIILNMTEITYSCQHFDG